MSELIDSIKSKPSLDEYRRIFTRLNANKSEQQLKKHFESCRDLAASQLEKHPFWIDLAKQIPDWDALYRKNTSAVGLYSGPFSAQALLNKKEWESLFSKIYRKNVINNENWPNPPTNIDRGWVTSNNIFNNVGDILRTQFICKYIDGVNFLSEQLALLAEKHSLTANNQLQATIDGYYAGHVDIEFPFEIIDMEFNPVQLTGKVEFQVTTQIKEIIKSLMHFHYELKRDSKMQTEPKNWQWDYKNPPFDANYLGHVAHYLEAQILKVRDQNANRQT